MLGQLREAEETHIRQAEIHVGNTSAGHIGGGKSKVFRYRPARFYPLTHPAANVSPADFPDCDDPPNPDSFQLWSAGANGKDEYGSGDDLPNWRKKK